MTAPFIPVLLAGGIGSRLWPLSREHYPKQLLSLLGEDSLLQATLRRVLQCENVDRFYVICNEQHRFTVLSQITQLEPNCEFKIILEPAGRNTAAAAALAAEYAPAGSQLLFMPADHLLQSVAPFVARVEQAKKLASTNKLVTFGVLPTYPEEGYGYIEVVENELAPHAYSIKQFVEKPNAMRAKAFIAAGHYYWNSGMFLFPKQLLLDELAEYSPEISRCIQAAGKTFREDNYFVRVDAATFCATPSDSIDYALMEHTQNGVMLALTGQWSDVGSWQALYEFEDKDSAGNVIQGEVININSTNCYLRSEEHLLAAVGLDNIIAVQTADCVLIANKDDTQGVKQVVQQLQQQGRQEAVQHLTRHHPWGVSIVMFHDDACVINRVRILPGHELSLHSHNNSSESWLVIAGTAEVQQDGQTQHYQAGEAFSIPPGVRHKISNNSADKLRLIELRTGAALDQEDITRHAQ
jgi:mannose-1-phosphate guanylyltransferase/mannose-6-phosphate isomerase